MTITVKWGQERLHIPYPDPRTTLGQLRNAIAAHTHLPPDSFKLIHSGAIMKDNSQPIHAYGLQTGSRITVVGGTTTFPGPPGSKAKEAPRTEASLISSIDNEVARVREQLTLPLETFSNTITTGGTPKEDMKQEHTRLGELLLQSLLRLDAMSPDSQWEQARLQRKAAVKEVQALLDSLDTTWKAAK